MNNTPQLTIKISGRDRRDGDYPSRKLIFEQDITTMSDKGFQGLLKSIYNVFLATQTHYDLGYIIKDNLGHTYLLTPEQENLLYHGGKK